MQKRSIRYLAALLPVQIILLQILKSFPNFVERYYSLGIYPVLSKTSRYLFGWIPFSIGDIFYTLIAVLAIRWLIRNFRNFRKKPLDILLEITANVSVVYLMFHLLWAFNYYRLPLHRALGIENEYSYEQLLKTTEEFIERSNTLHSRLSSVDSLPVSSPYSQKELFSLASGGYQNLQKDFPKLSYEPKSIKKSLWSLPLTYMGYSGYLNPFSGEAQVNAKIPGYKFAVVVCHEEAHQIGFAAENEANFIAVLATLYNDDLYIRYTGSIFALRYLLADVARNNMDDFERLRETIRPGILENYREMDRFWDAYENPFEIIFITFWDNFLKASNQEGGIRSYSYMTALLVNYSLE